jgi:hypothetical protein
VERTEVLHSKLLLESCSGMLEKHHARGGEDDIIDIQQQVSSVGATTVDEEQDVRLGLLEAQGDQVGGEAVVPSSRRLLKAVEGLVEPVQQLTVSCVNEASRVGAVDCLDGSVVEEDVLDVELMHWPTPKDSQRRHSPDGGELHNEPGCWVNPRRTQ